MLPTDLQHLTDLCRREITDTESPKLPSLVGLIDGLERALEWNARVRKVQVQDLDLLLLQLVQANGQTLRDLLAPLCAWLQDSGELGADDGPRRRASELWLRVSWVARWVRGRGVELDMAMGIEGVDELDGCVAAEVRCANAGNAQDDFDGFFAHIGVAVLVGLIVVLVVVNEGLSK